MKHTIFLTAIVVFAFSVYGCGRTSIESYAPVGETVFDASGSYALGMNIGTNFRVSGIFPDMEEFARGMVDALRGETRYTMEEAAEVFHNAYMAITERRNEVSRQAETEFLAENATRPGIIVTASGLQYEVIIEGDGPRPGPFDTVRVHYEGTLIDGTVFDSSHFRGVPVEFPLHQVIAGWTEGLQLMTVGSIFRFFIPSDLGYGSQGMGPQIPPYSTLIFEVELIDILTDE
ncbi:MAG: FKBP-type peptidyl-prolyl cis-trans isomerase [Treponema sp.]|nr:FKBP-type peptidyl-prolyl cis-trans isomerase [Treponema sp.]